MSGSSKYFVFYAGIVFPLLFISVTSFFIEKATVMAMGGYYTRITISRFNSRFVNKKETTEPEYFYGRAKTVADNTQPFVFSIKENFFPGIFSIEKHKKIMDLYSLMAEKEFSLKGIGSFFDRVYGLGIASVTYFIVKINRDATKSMTQKFFGININIPFAVCTIIIGTVGS
jgi:hypothetical protein